MINVTNSSVVNTIQETGRTFHASIKANVDNEEVTFSDIQSLKHTSMFTSKQQISVGETISSFIEAEIHDCKTSLQNKEVQVTLSMEYYDSGDSSEESSPKLYEFPLGYFTVQEPSKADNFGTQKITAYDRMANMSKRKFGDVRKAYYTQLYSPVPTLKTMFECICDSFGYEADTTNIYSLYGIDDDFIGVDNTQSVDIVDKNNNIYVPIFDTLDKCDCRTVLGYIASALGKNCVVGTDGKFRMVGYSKVSYDETTDTGFKVPLDTLDTLEFPSNTTKVDSIALTVATDESYSEGTGNSKITFVNPIFSQLCGFKNRAYYAITPAETLPTLLSTIQESTNTNYYPNKFKQISGDPRIEIGDTVAVQYAEATTDTSTIADTDTDEDTDTPLNIKIGYVPVMSLIREFDGGLTISVESYEPEQKEEISTEEKTTLLEDTMVTTSEDKDEETGLTIKNKSKTTSGSAEYSKIVVDSDGNESTLSHTYVGEAGLSILCSKAKQETWALPSNWGNMNAVQKINWIVNFLEDQAKVKSYGINVETYDTTNSEDPSISLAHLDGFGLAFPISLKGNSKYLADGAKVDGDIQFKRTYTDSSGEEQTTFQSVSDFYHNYSQLNDDFTSLLTALGSLTPKRFSVTYATGEEATHARFWCAWNSVNMTYRGSYKAHAADDLLFTIPAEYKPPSTMYAPITLATDVSGQPNIAGAIKIDSTNGNVTIHHMGTATYSTRVYLQVSYCLGTGTTTQSEDNLDDYTA